MFYSVDLLTLRRNGIFTKCWLAANLTRKVFFSKFRRHTIDAISIPRSSEELIEYVITQDAERRFSLYLSAQLMFGLTRIYYYQIDECLKYHLKLWITINASSITDVAAEVERDLRTEPIDLPVEQMQPPPLEPSSPVHLARNLVDDVNRITLFEPDVSVHGYEWMMRDADNNFGALTAEQMDQLLDHDGLCFDTPQSRQIRVLPEIESEDISHTFAVPQSIQRVTSQDAIVDIDKVFREDDALDEIPRIPEIVEEPGLTTVLQPPDLRIGTPSKHKLSTLPGIETPTKKRRGLEAEYDTSVTIPVPVPHLDAIEQPSAQIVPRTPSIHMSFESLTSSVFQMPLTKKKSRKLIIDTHMKLPVTAKVVRKEKYSETPIELLRQAIQREAAAQLFITPSTQQPWSKTLLVNYQMMLVTPIPSSLVDRRRRTRPTVGSPREPIRGPDISGAERSGELSQDIHRTVTSEDVSSRTKTIEQVSVDEDSRPQRLPQLVDVPSLEHVETALELPEDILQPLEPGISSSPRIVRDIIGNGVEHELPQSPGPPMAPASLEKSDIGVEPDTLSIRSSGRTWTRLDILGLLELLWLQNRVVRFRDICPPSSNNRRDAGQIMALLLDLQRVKEVRLTQATPYADIFIQQYSHFF